MSQFGRLAGLCLAGLAVAAAATQPMRAAGSSDPRTSRTLEDFDGISLGGPDSVIVTRADAFSVRTEGDPESIAQLDIFVRDNVLHIGRHHERGTKWKSAGHGATVYVSMPVLRRAVLGGSGTIRADAMSGTQVDLALGGSGEMTIDGLDAREARLSIAGSGSLTVRGRAEHSNVSIAGSGDVFAQELRSSDAKVSVAGSGNAVVHASDSAAVSVLGSGDVTVHGTRNCKVSKFGSGDVNCVA